jgi:hypothetical protein
MSKAEEPTVCGTINGLESVAGLERGAGVMACRKRVSIARVETRVETRVESDPPAIELPVLPVVRRAG